jgi:hypothetical protein
MPEPHPLQERCPIAHLEGHRSWVDCVRFDSYAVGASSSSEEEGEPSIYRLVSVGQDARMCLWEVEASTSDSKAPDMGHSPSMR